MFDVCLIHSCREFPRFDEFMLESMMDSQLMMKVMVMVKMKVMVMVKGMVMVMVKGMVMVMVKGMVMVMVKGMGNKRKDFIACCSSK
jgi:hypothetical protein